MSRAPSTHLHVAPSIGCQNSLDNEDIRFLILLYCNEGSFMRGRSSSFLYTIAQGQSVAMERYETAGATGIYKVSERCWRVLELLCDSGVALG
ncbi:hypothetical protein Baya_3177 [Bagarius yarrelli]|uniref:Uncharacterized protein n=1 Tax=Bagarius yarrelli TaxID=175774 RepID=A0A556TUS1_BAGYA|nr:hypothetical protein Baya_3177 [Bagarius yarrelli]